MDAFAERPFTGNPAAVCVLDGPRPDTWMQDVARELNLSETAFLHPIKDGFRLRWFTPTMEVDLCGHATLASAHVLWTEGHLSPGTAARFHTRSGLLTTLQRDNWIEMDFPAEPSEPVTDSSLCNELASALGAKPLSIEKNRWDYLVELDSEETIRNLAPDFMRLAALPARGVMVTSPSTEKQYDFISRFFAPGSGIPEDPVTGSAHCCLGPFWSDRLNKKELLAYQASERGGEVRIHCQGDRVLLAGKAVTVLRAELV